MIFVSVTEAAGHLGIDAKTLHRWLAEAQLALQSHPHDGRKKGLSQEHLHNHNYILRLAPNHELTIAVLEQVAEALQAHVQ